MAALLADGPLEDHFVSTDWYLDRRKPEWAEAEKAGHVRYEIEFHAVKISGHRPDIYEEMKGNSNS